MKPIQLLLFALLCPGSATVLALGEVPTESGSYCLDEVNRYFDGKFADTLKITEIKQSSNGFADMDTDFEYWVRAAECDGFFIARFPVSTKVCTVSNSSRGRQTHYMRSVEATKDCRQFLPKSDRMKSRWHWR